MRKIMVILLVLCVSVSFCAEQIYVWWEGEDADSHTFGERRDFLPANDEQASKLSGGKWLQTGKGSGAEAVYTVDVPEDGEYFFWSRKFWKHGPFSWDWNGTEKGYCGRDCVLADGVSLRKHLGANWVPLGKVNLKAGKNTLKVTADKETTAICFDAWLIIKGPFVPKGKMKPGVKYNRTEDGWFSWEPGIDPFSEEALLDLRYLHKGRAGSKGRIIADGPDFKFEKTGEKVSFWSVAPLPNNIGKDPFAEYLAKRLAKSGVNMIRSGLHGGLAPKGNPMGVDMAMLDRYHYLLKTTADEGIYHMFGFYWYFTSPVRADWGIPEMTGKKPTTLIYFHPRMQEIYKSWLKKMLTTKNPYTGMSIAEDPAVAMVEINNEDSYFFWTFKPYQTISGEAMRPLEKQFGDWLVKKYGSLEKAKEAWGEGGEPSKLYAKFNVPADDWENGYIRHYQVSHFTGHDWAVSQRNAQRASDNLQFLVEQLRGFYTDITKYIRDELGCKALIVTANWHTADHHILEAVDKYVNLSGDVMDRHGYFGGYHKGEAASYAIRKGHVYADRSGMKETASLIKELQYGNVPHGVSEYDYYSPNRFRAEEIWLGAAYGALGGNDFLNMNGMGTPFWLSTLNKFTPNNPSKMGLFHSASIIYRKNYIKEGPVVWHAGVKLSDLFAFKGSPAVVEQNLDELRKAEIPAGMVVEKDIPSTLDPLAFYVGQVTMEIAENPGKSTEMNLSKLIDRKNKIVKSATGELEWDWGKGIAKALAPKAQGVCGFAGAAGEIDLPDLKMNIQSEYVASFIVPLDDKPIASSKKILLQIITEDRNYGWKTEEKKVISKNGNTFTAKKITDLGGPPLIVKNVEGAVSFKRADASKLKVIALDGNGYKREVLASSADSFTLLPDVVSYIITSE